jgi:hypothetical protein
MRFDVESDRNDVSPTEAATRVVPAAAEESGVEGISESLSKEVRPLRVKVTIIEPK